MTIIDNEKGSKIIERDIKISRYKAYCKDENNTTKEYLVLLVWCGVGRVI